MYTDIHCHVIWGVDDGAQTEEETQKMLRDAAADGIDRIIVTSHVTPGVYRFPEDVFQRHFARAEEYIRQEGLGIVDGYEDGDFRHDDGNGLSTFS